MHFIFWGYLNFLFLIPQKGTGVAELIINIKLFQSFLLHKYEEDL